MIDKVKIVNDISVEDFLLLREKANFQILQKDQAKCVLKNTTYIAVARYKDKNIGVTRLLFDHGTDAYITDVIVAPEYQGKGVGRLLIEDVLRYIKHNAFSGVKVTCNLYANKGKEHFYENMGFEVLPNRKYGRGMILELSNCGGDKWLG